MLKIISGFYTELDQIIGDCEVKTMKVAGQILVLWNDAKNDLDVNEYQRENQKKIHRVSTYRTTVSASILPDDHWMA